MIYEIFKVVSKIGLFSTLIPFILLFFIYSKTHRKSWWVLFFIVTTWLLSDSIGWILANYGKNSLIVYNISSIVSTCFYIWLFVILRKNRRFSTILLCVTVSYVSFALIYFMFWKSLYKPAPFVDTFSGLIPLVLSVMFFYDLLKSLREPNVLKYPYYWINTAIMVHFGVTFFAYLFLEFFYLDTNISMYLWLIIIFSNIIYNMLLAKGIWLIKRT